MTPMIVEHPLLQHKISILRNKQTGTKEFRDLVGEIATLLCYEATRDLPLEEVEIETPITMAKTKVLAGRKLALVPILRAGMGMLDGKLTLLPAAKVGFIGLYRDEETLQPVRRAAPGAFAARPAHCCIYYSTEKRHHQQKTGAFCNFLQILQDQPQPGHRPPAGAGGWKARMRRCTPVRGGHPVRTARCPRRCVLRPVLPA